MVPPSHMAVPEQLKDGEEMYNMFSADVFNLGRTLQIEIQKVHAVSIYDLTHHIFTSSVDYVEEPPSCHHHL
jgi:hypothetical protein